MKNNPEISIVMPVHNGAAFVAEAIESILVQTMPEFELIVVNDASTDHTLEIANSFTDRRIRVIDLEHKAGCYPARNNGMREARGKYICVMDADDVCVPHRLAVQYRFLEDHPETGMIGSAYRFVNSSDPIYREINYDIIKLMLLRFCYLLHPTCMIRHSLVRQHSLYYEENFTYASDYAWQVKASTLFHITNVNEILLLYRKHAGQISTGKAHEQGMFANQVRIRQLTSLHINVDENNAGCITSFIHGDPVPKEYWPKLDDFTSQMLASNAKCRYYQQHMLQDMLDVLWKTQIENN